mmetsp:Transcript_30667/g.79571  ORF Transcript_30667/g.79571 Transcript_30667/m.79571 type:complete len:328 (+) Transcript_30667:678-1661(+)
MATSGGRSHATRRSAVTWASARVRPGILSMGPCRRSCGLAESATVRSWRTTKTSAHRGSSTASKIATRHVLTTNRRNLTTWTSKACISSIAECSMWTRSCRAGWSRHPRLAGPRRPHHSRGRATDTWPRWRPDPNPSRPTRPWTRRWCAHPRPRRHAAHLRTAHAGARRHTHAASHTGPSEARTRWTTHRGWCAHSRWSHSRRSAHARSLSGATNASSRSATRSSGSWRGSRPSRAHGPGTRSLGCIPIARGRLLSSRSKARLILLRGRSRSIIWPNLSALEWASRLLKAQLFHCLRSRIENAISKERRSRVVRNQIQVAHRSCNTT